MYAVFASYNSNGEGPGFPPIELIAMLASWAARKNKNREAAKMRVVADG